MSCDYGEKLVRNDEARRINLYFMIICSDVVPLLVYRLLIIDAYVVSLVFFSKGCANFPKMSIFAKILVISWLNH